MDWREPRTRDPRDVAAAERALQFQLGAPGHPTCSLLSLSVSISLCLAASLPLRCLVRVGARVCIYVCASSSPCCSMTCPGTTTGWFADPIFGDRGDYPESMRALLGDLLPRFTPAQVRGAESGRERSRGTTTRYIQLD